MPSRKTKRDQRQPEGAARAHDGESRRAVELALERDRDLLLDLFGGETRRLRDDLRGWRRRYPDRLRSQAASTNSSRRRAAKMQIIATTRRLRSAKPTSQSIIEQHSALDDDAIAGLDAALDDDLRRPCWKPISTRRASNVHGATSTKT